MGKVACLVFFLLLGACARSKETRPQEPDTAAPQLSVFIASDLRGYLGPCGCSENMRGGIARAAQQLAQARKGGDVVFLDAGDALFPRVKIPEAAVPQERRKAQALATAFLQMGLAA